MGELCSRSPVYSEINYTEKTYLPTDPALHTLWSPNEVPLNKWTSAGRSPLTPWDAQSMVCGQTRKKSNRNWLQKSLEKSKSPITSRPYTDQFANERLENGKNSRCAGNLSWFKLKALLGFEYIRAQFHVISLFRSRVHNTLSHNTRWRLNQLHALHNWGEQNQP